MQEVNIESYNYNLPDNRIAEFPLENRENSKLFVCKKGQFSHSHFYNLIDELPPNSHLVFNDSKVIPARLFFKSENQAKIEIFLLKPYQKPVDEALSSNSLSTWECIIGNKKKWKENDILNLELQIGGDSIIVKASYFNYTSNIVSFVWNNQAITFSQIIEKLGAIPLPPYIKREAQLSDQNSYQTVYSHNKGAVAAPTAGLHFTKNILNDLVHKGHSTQFITLHVGAGTFLPVKETNVLNHPMHNETILITQKSIELLIKNLGNTIPVGTTSMRTIESTYWLGHKLSQGYQIPVNGFFIEKLYPYNTTNSISTLESLNEILVYMQKNNLDILSGQTEILIVPGYEFKLSNGLITNFHQPKSTLIVLIASFIGETWKKLYQEALDNNYRFLSYGDSSLLIP
jgi:S-adenosylmethionine:tRNA ribosyltransferase-isomerase